MQSGCCALAGQNTRSDWVCLDLFAPLFASRQKVENKLLKDCLKSKDISI